MVKVKVKIKDLKDRALDYAVAKCEWPGRSANWLLILLHAKDGQTSSEYQPSINRWQGGPIIEREGIATRVHCVVNDKIESWVASRDWPLAELRGFSGPTPLIAAMRCYVASKLGDEVEIPEELINET